MNKTRAVDGFPDLVRPAIYTFAPVTLIHLILRVYRVFVHVHTYARTSCTECMRMYVPAHVYTKTSVSTLSEELRAPWFQNILPFLVEFLIFRVLGGALSSIWQIAFPKCYILYFPARQPSPRDPLSRPGEITRHRVCNVHEICIFLKRQARGLLYGDIRSFIFLSTLA